MLKRMQPAFVILLICLTGGMRTVAAEPLPLVTGVTYDGNVISWQTIDGAAGYNIYRDFEYLHTVRGVSKYVPDGEGEYRIIAFDDNGNFSPLREFGPDGELTTNIAIVESVNTALAPPQNVFGTVFSKSAGEIYWDRDASQILIYTVAINGVALDTTDGTSYWVDSLLPNALNRVSVLAENRNFTKSVPVTLFFDTRVDALPAAATEVDPNTSETEVQPPQNARIDVYSRTAAELFWDRAGASENIVTTEVYRNGELLGMSPGNSFFDDNRMHNVDYKYELIAINENGERSLSAFINPGPFDTDDETVVLSLLSGVSAATTGIPHLEWYPVLSAIRFDDLPVGIVEASLENIFEDGVLLTRTEYNCDSGSLVAERTDGFSATTSLVFDECNFQQAMIEGKVDFFAEGGLYEIVNYDELTIYSQDILSLDGSVSSSRARGTSARTINYDGFEYYLAGDLDDEDTIDTIITLNQTMSYEGNELSDISTFTTSMTASAPWTLGKTLTVNTDEVFSKSDANEPNYTVGRLTIQSGNDERLILSADTGNPATWSAELITASGSRQSNGDWNDLIRLPCILLDDDCQ